MPEVDYLAWNYAIATNFFTAKSANLPVFLHVNDETIEELGSKIGLRPDEAVTSFVRVVRGCSFRPHQDTFEWFSNISYRWELRYEYPPYIGLLGMLVLAASHMSSADDFSSANYYAHLTNLMGREINQREIGLLDKYWEDLNKWLESKQGHLGLSTARRHPHFTHIGYPLSQILLRKADLDCLPDFFVWADLSPDTIPSKQTIFEKFWEWIGRTTCTLDSHLYQLIYADFFNEMLKDTIAEVLQRELARWVVSLDKNGRAYTNRSSINLHFYKDVGGWIAHLIAPLPEGFPPGDWEDEHKGITLYHDSGSEWIGCELPPELVPPLINAGITFKNGDSSMQAVFQSVVVFTGNSQLSGWVSCERVQLGEEHLFLYQTDYVSQINEYLDKFAVPGWKTENFAEGLVLSSGVTIQYSTSLMEANIPFERLRPHITANIRLKGGLKLDTTTWLKSYEPTAWVEIPPALDEVPISIDNIMVMENACGLVILDLRGQGLGNGEHTISVGNIRSRSFTLAEHLRSVAELIQPEVGGFVINNHGVLYDREAVAPRLDGADIRINENNHVIVCTPGFREYIVLGENPGEFKTLKPPLKSLRHPDRPFLATVPFSPQWIIHVGKKHRRYLHLIGKPVISKKQLLQPTTRAWEHATRRTYENLRRDKLPSDHIIRRLWEDYCKQHG